MIFATSRQRKALEIENKKWPEALRQVPKEQWLVMSDRVIEVWRSRAFLVQIYQEADGIERLSVCVTRLDGERWVAGISWDDLQRLKSECGRGDKEAVEIFPADRHVVNVANMRHLWVLPSPLPFSWKKREQK